MPGEDAGAGRPHERYEDLVDELIGASGAGPCAAPGAAAAGQPSASPPPSA